MNKPKLSDGVVDEAEHEAQHCYGVAQGAETETAAILRLMGSVKCRPKGMRNWNRFLWDEIRTSVPVEAMRCIAICLVFAQRRLTDLANLKRERSEVARQLSRPRRRRGDQCDRFLDFCIENEIPVQPQIETVRLGQPELADRLLLRWLERMMDPGDTWEARHKLGAIDIRLAEKFLVLPGHTKPSNRVLDGITYMLVATFEYYTCRPHYPMVGQLLQLASLETVGKKMTARERYGALAAKARQRMNKCDASLMATIWHR